MFIYSLEIKTNCWILDILIACFFYNLIFKIKLYKHHYLSMILIVLTGLFIDLFFGNLQNDITKNILLLLLRLLRQIFHTSVDIINKYVMEKKYCSVYDLCLYVGIIDIILFGIFSIINYYYLKLDDFEKYFSNFDINEILSCLGHIISQFGIIFSALITNKNNSPCHIFIIFVFGQLAYYIDFSTYSIILIICIIFILFFSLVFNEIIEINFWGLSYNTRKNIIKRAESEDTNLEGRFSSKQISDNYMIDNIQIELEEKDDLNDDEKI